MICRLCHKEKPLIKAHIIPEFMYRDLYDKSNKFFYTENILKIKPTIKQKGLRDNTILCETCDNEILGSLEKYCQKVLYGRNLKGSDKLPMHRQISHDGQELRWIGNINYKNFKLFLLSILWRASISNLPFFKEVNLGEYEGQIRDMIYFSKVCSDKEFRIAMILYRDTDIYDISKSISSPKKLENNGQVSYVFYINGMLYFFEVTPCPDNSIFALGNLSETNSLTIPVIDFEYLKIFMKKLFGLDLP